MGLRASTSVHWSITQIAEQAVATSVRRLCRGGTVQGLARELGWKAVILGSRDLRRLESLSSVAEARLVASVDDTVWSAEQTALRSRQEYLEAHPGDREGALTAATLDANEEAVRLMEAAYKNVLAGLIADSTVTPPVKRRLRRGNGAGKLAA
jgi:hypothetical protein